MSLLNIRRILKPNEDYVAHLSAYHFQGKYTLEETDPFIMLAHHGPQVLGPDNAGMPFAPHPHKGFETVTLIYAGDVLHHDSMGVESVIGAGGVQWMTAGAGIVHSENTSPAFRKEGGTLDLVQLWINLPSRQKGVPPHYQGFTAEVIPVVLHAEGRVKEYLVSGESAGISGPAHSLTGVRLSTIELQPEGVFSAKVPAGKQVLLFVMEGELEVNGAALNGRSLVLFDLEGGDLQLTASAVTRVIFGFAEPTGEPIAARGPFVMNTDEEIREAIRQYQSGKMGVLAE